MFVAFAVFLQLLYATKSEAAFLKKHLGLTKIPEASSIRIRNDVQTFFRESVSSLLLSSGGFAKSRTL